MIQFAATHLADEIARLSAHLHAATYRLLVLIHEFDRTEGWAEHGGFRSCAHWLSWRTGVAPGAAREKVRVARALAGLARTSEAMQRGELSYSKVRAMTRVATAANEAELLEVARHASASQLERIVRAWRRVDRLEAGEAERRERRHLRLHVDEDGMYVVRGRLDPEVGALLEKALAWAEDQLWRDAPEAQRVQTTVSQRRADAVGLLAERALDGEGSARADRYAVVLHVGGSEADNSLGVSAETSRRLACDAGLVVMTHDSGGGVLDVGRKRRTLPAALRRALEARDRHCSFPGCGVRHTEAHHITHWARGGPTKLDNLVLLCRLHHRAVHEGGWGVALGEDGRALFRRPDGRRLDAVPGSVAASGREIEAEHERRRIRPDAWSTAPRSLVGTLDLRLAVEMTRGGSAGAPRAPAVSSTEVFRLREARPS